MRQRSRRDVSAGSDLAGVKRPSRLNRLRALIVSLFSLVIVASGTSPASATAYADVSGTVPHDGSMVAYATYRTTTGSCDGLPATVELYVFYMYYIPGLRIGLRDTNNVQFTDTTVFSEPSIKRLTTATLQGTRFAINARAGSSFPSHMDPNWNGSLCY